jgi:hypothetical protein
MENLPPNRPEGRFFRKFPVKIPVSRDFVWTVCDQRRQPAAMLGDVADAAICYTAASAAPTYRRLLQGCFK